MLCDDSQLRSLTRESENVTHGARRRTRRRGTGCRRTTRARRGALCAREPRAARAGLRWTPYRDEGGKVERSAREEAPTDERGLSVRRGVRRLGDRRPRGGQEAVGARAPAQRVQTDMCGRLVARLRGHAGKGMGRRGPSESRSGRQTRGHQARAGRRRSRRASQRGSRVSSAVVTGCLSISERSSQDPRETRADTRGVVDLDRNCSLTHSVSARMGSVARPSPPLRSYTETVRADVEDASSSLLHLSLLPAMPPPPPAASSGRPKSSTAGTTDSRGMRRRHSAQDMRLPPQLGHVGPPGSGRAGAGTTSMERREGREETVQGLRAPVPLRRVTSADLLVRLDADGEGDDDDDDRDQFSSDVRQLRSWLIESALRLTSIPLHRTSPSASDLPRSPRPRPLDARRCVVPCRLLSSTELTVASSNSGEACAWKTGRTGAKATLSATCALLSSLDVAARKRETNDTSSAGQDHRLSRRGVRRRRFRPLRHRDRDTAERRRCCGASPRRIARCPPDPC